MLDHQQYPAPVDFSGSISLGTQEHLLETLAELDAVRGKLGREHGQHLLYQAKQRACDAGIEQSHCHQRHGDLLDTVKELEENMRLLIMGRQGEDSEKAASHVGSHIENVVRTLSRPILVTPQQFISPERVLIAYDGSVTSRKCVDMIAVSPLLKSLGCHLSMASHKTDDAIEHLRWAEKQLSSAGFQVVSNISPGDVENIILEYCVKQIYICSPWAPMVIHAFANSYWVALLRIS